MKVEIQDAGVTEISGTIKNGPRAGQPYRIRKQVGWVFNGQAYPQKFEFNLDDENPGYAPGNYVIAPASFVVGDFSALQIGKLVLLKDESKPATAR